MVMKKRLSTWGPWIRALSHLDPQYSGDSRAPPKRPEAHSLGLSLGFALYSHTYKLWRSLLETMLFPLQPGGWPNCNERMRKAKGLIQRQTYWT